MFETILLKRFVNIQKYYITRDNVLKTFIQCYIRTLTKLT